MIAALKKRIADGLKGVVEGAASDPLVGEAMRWRDAIAEDTSGGGPYDFTVKDALSIRVDDVTDREGQARAGLLSRVALNLATPLDALVPDWLTEAKYSGRTEAARKRAIRLFREWCGTTKVEPTLEAVTRKVAGRFVAEVFVNRAVDPGTANKSVSGLSAYWSWLNKRGHLAEGTNPWRGQSVPANKKRQREDGHGTKRPFRDDEVKTLIGGIRMQPLADLSLAAALTGCRISELADLLVGHINASGRTLWIGDGKNESAVRVVPIHHAIAPMFVRRTDQKPTDAFVFHELPVQTNPARKRSAPVSQAFVRERRRLMVDDVIENVRQSRVDFHSWRRWFIRKAVEALERGAVGFTAWTIADVVGHSKDDGPLPMTMGRYPGAAGEEARRACVEAVQLPAPLVGSLRPA